MTTATHILTMQRQAGSPELAHFLRGVALIAGTPLLGFLFVIVLPLGGLVALLLISGRVLGERMKAFVGIALRHG